MFSTHLWRGKKGNVCCNPEHLEAVSSVEKKHMPIKPLLQLPQVDYSSRNMHPRHTETQSVVRTQTLETAREKVNLAMHTERRGQCRMWIGRSIPIVTCGVVRSP